MLQELNKDNFPLERYIVDVNKNVLPPSYLAEADDAEYKIRNVLEGNVAEILPVHMFRPQEWPPHWDFNLDESQFEAFRAALTKQIVVIQGPPGMESSLLPLHV